MCPIWWFIVCYDMMLCENSSCGEAHGKVMISLQKYWIWESVQFECQETSKKNIHAYGKTLLWYITLKSLNDYAHDSPELIYIFLLSSFLDFWHSYYWRFGCFFNIFSFIFLPIFEPVCVTLLIFALLLVEFLTIRIFYLFLEPVINLRISSSLASSCHLVLSMMCCMGRQVQLPLLLSVFLLLSMQS